MKLANPSKAFILLVGLICLTVLLAIGKIETESGIPIITMIIGYGVGNGIGAARGQNSPHIFEPATEEPR
jgi:hypothetical protein